MPCQRFSGFQPRVGKRPSLSWPASRRGIAPMVFIAMLILSARIRFIDGATKGSVAAIAWVIVSACISLIAALTEVSLALSAVQARAATWPGGVIVPTFSWLGGRTGPFSVQRRVRVTGGASLISMMVLRVSNALKPSGVRYSSGFSGFSSSI